MHSLTADFDTFSNELIVAVVVPAIRVEVEIRGSEAQLSPSFSTLSLKCVMERLERSELG